MVVSARRLAGETAAAAKVSTQERLESAKARALADAEFVRGQAFQAKESAAVKAKELYTTTGELVAKKSFQTTAASAAAGGMALGAGGAAAGTVTGSVAGAVAGLPLALFTFGLSIPVGAVVGRGAGLVLGTSAGAVTGVLGGGAAGFGAYQKKDDFASVGSSALLKASSGAEVVKGQVFSTVVYARDKVSAAKARLMGGQAATM